MKHVYSQQRHFLRSSNAYSVRDFIGKNFLTLLGGAFILLTFIMFLLGVLYQYGLPTLPYDPYQINLDAVFTTPGLSHWMGTDYLGRDILSRVIIGTQAYTIPGLLAVLVAVFLGVGMGAVWGYYGELKPNVPLIRSFLPDLEVLMNYSMNVINSFPRFVLIIMVCAIFSTNIYFIMFVVGLTSSPDIAEIVKNKVLLLKEQNFIEAAQAIGVRPGGIIFRHIIWHHCKAVIIVQTTYLLGYVVFIETSLSYLGGGFGVQEPRCSWGNMLASGKEYFFEGMFWPSVFPALMIVLTILSFILLGDGINKHLKLQKERG